MVNVCQCVWKNGCTVRRNDSLILFFFPHSWYEGQIVKSSWCRLKIADTFGTEFKF